MTEIKFRYFVLSENKIMYAKDFLLCDVEYNLIQYADQGWYVNNKDAEPEFVAMQYSGIKDMHQQEIFDGDIIKDVLTGMIMIVRYGRNWKSAYVGWYCENKKMNYITNICGDYDTNINSQIKVIGNMYENNELLNELV